MARRWWELDRSLGDVRLRGDDMVGSVREERRPCGRSEHATRFGTLVLRAAMSRGDAGEQRE